MEIYGYHPILKKKVEIGNSGIFRPEMLAPMVMYWFQGLPKDVNVIAWGLSLERPTMIQYNVGNIRDLFGHKVNLKYIRDNPICCFKWLMILFYDRTYFTHKKSILFNFFFDRKRIFFP